MLSALALLGAIGTLAARQPRAWQPAKVIAVQPPVSRVDPGRSPDPVYGTDIVPGWSNPDVKPPLPLYTERRTNLWLYAFQSSEGTYYAAADSPRRQSFLRSLKVGDQVRLATAGRNLYLIDADGKEHKLMRFESRNAPPPKQ